MHDLRFAVRLLRKSPMFTFVAVATLALAIAANTVIFTGLNAVLLRPLPYPQPDRLVRVYTEFPTMNLRKFPFSPPELTELQRDARSFASLGAWQTRRTNLTGGDRPEEVRDAYVTATLMPTLGVQPLLGRNFTADEDRPNGPKAAIISHRLWQQYFRGTPDVLGKSVHLGGVSTTIVGVMPRGFDFPTDGVDVWEPIQIDPASNRWGSHGLEVVGRLNAGATTDSALAEIKDLARRWKAENHEHNIEFDTPERGHPIVLRDLKGEVIESARSLLWIMQGVVLLVLLIACANISNLLVARADVRRSEIAVRTALGASRWRLSRQFLVESLVLGGCGAMVGLLITPWALDAMISLLPELTPRANEIRIDGGVLAFAIVCALAASVVFGFAPIVHTRASGIATALGAAASRATGSAASLRLRRALVVAEIALATVLVVGAGLFVRSFVALQHVDPGFRAEGLVAFQMLVPPAELKSEDEAIRFHVAMRDKLAAMPGVESVAALMELPPNHPALFNDIYFVGKTQDKSGPAWNVDYWQVALDDFTKTLGSRIVKGRSFEPHDDENGQLVALVNEAFMRKFYPGEDPVGQRIRAVWDTDPEVTIVGVVADMKTGGLDKPAGTEIIFPLRQVTKLSKEGDLGLGRRISYVLRATGDTRALFASINETVAAAAPTIPAARLSTMDDVLYREVAKPRFLTAMIVGFAAISLVMAVVGVYGVMSYSVVQRSREIGIRLALGAPPDRVLGMLLRQGLALTAVGIAVGLGAAFALARVVSSTLSGVLFGSSSLDGPLLALVVVALAAVAALACYIPARRAARIPPMLAIRVEA